MSLSAISTLLLKSSRDKRNGDSALFCLGKKIKIHVCHLPAVQFTYQSKTQLCYPFKLLLELFVDIKDHHTSNRPLVTYFYYHLSATEDHKTHVVSQAAELYWWDKAEGREN